METRICLDTDFLINLLRGKQEDIEFAKNAQSKSILATTIINVFELYYGAFLLGKQKEIDSADTLIQKLIVLNQSIESSKLAGKIKAGLDHQGKPIDFRDVLIGSIALKEDYSLKTGNLNHFERIRGLKLI